MGEKEDPVIIIEDPPGEDEKPGGTTGGTTSGGSSAPAVDPITAQRMNMFQQIYMQLWGEPAPEAYLKSAANGGLNSYEFALQERSKPAWTQTKAFKDAFTSKASLAVQMGAR